MADQKRSAIWDGKDVLEPFYWPHASLEVAAWDLFEPEVRGKLRDEAFATMALCPHHRFQLSTAYPKLYRRFVDEIAGSRDEYLGWRMSAATILRKLGREGEAAGDGPVWPLRNVELVDEQRAR